MKAEKTTSFEPIAIGSPDSKKEAEIIKIYADVCEQATSLLWNLEFYLGYPDKLDLSVLFDFLKSKDPQKLLYEKFIEFNNITFPFGISIDKIIELGMVDVPKEKFENLLTWREDLLAAIEKTKNVSFYYPLEKLFDERIDNRWFAITAKDMNFESREFDEKLYKFVRRFTANERENEIIRGIDQFVEAANNLISLGLLPNNKQKWLSKINSLIDLLVFDYTVEENPLSINPLFAWRQQFQQHFEKRPFGSVLGRMEDILKTEAPVDQSEAANYAPEFDVNFDEVQNIEENIIDSPGEPSEIETV